MFRNLKFLWHLKNKRYVFALAAIHDDCQFWQSKRILAMYDLNMYWSLRNINDTPPEWRCKLAVKVAKVACGDISLTPDLLAKFKNEFAEIYQRVELAKNLASYSPAFSLSLLDDVDNYPLDLYAALQLRVGLSKRAISTLAQIDYSSIVSSPDILLLQNNAFRETPKISLNRLNAYYTHFGLSPVALADIASPLSPCNVITSIPSSTHTGPLISILMTTYNTGRRVENAVISLLNQTYRSFELIIVDDASTDDTLFRLQRLALKDTRIKIISLPQNVGTYAAKRIGLIHAKGEFVTCHDSDDWSHPEKLFRQISPLLLNPKLICSISDWVRLQDNGIFYARAVYPLKRLNPSSLLFRRADVLQKAGVWDCVKTGADSEFIARLKLIFGASSIHRIKLPLTLGSHRTDSLMNSSTTGYTSQGISLDRQKYWDSWSRWHIQALRNKESLYIGNSDFTNKNRPFSAPDSILVETNAIKAALRSAHVNFTSI
ncbi:glycosyltransferase family 2 protein [Escherichia coli]|nr:glycosyltransferase family 2 protein [Escherichia coli]MEB7936216.1 glycosyltransferase family 2 protein [Escherichia whittamii]